MSFFAVHKSNNYLHDAMESNTYYFIRHDIFHQTKTTNGIPPLNKNKQDNTEYQYLMVITKIKFNLFITNRTITFTDT